MGNEGKETKEVVCHDMHNNEFKVVVDKLTFRPSVYGVLLNEGKVLLSKQWDGYDIPGGGVHIHETIKEALKREFFEETGVKVELIKPIYCDTSFFIPTYSKSNKKEHWNCVLIYYLVRKVGGYLSKDNLDEEEQEYVDMPEWIDLEKINDLKFYNSVDSVHVIKQAVEYNI